MSVGVAEFDKDHQRMLLLLQEIQAVVAAGDAAHAHALTVNLLALAGRGLLIADAAPSLVGNRDRLRAILFPSLRKRRRKLSS